MESQNNKFNRKMILLILIVSFALTITVVLILLRLDSKINSNNTEKHIVSSNIEIVTIDDMEYNIIKNMYSKDYKTVKAYYYNPDNKAHKFHTSGIILNYNEYVKELNKFKDIAEVEEETYSVYDDMLSNYLVISYGNNHSNVSIDVIDLVVNDTNKEITLYIREEILGCMGSGQAYYLAIPVNCSKDYKISIEQCVLEEEIEQSSSKGNTHRDMDICYKPIIYLYPEKETSLELTLDLDGVLTTTYPKYNNGWKITAYPDGTLVGNSGREYNYLFWEGEHEFEKEFKEGFCIKGEDTEKFLETALTKIGLTDKEQCDFITYWLPKMECNNYNLIHFMGDEYKDIAKLECSTKIDTEIRVFMIWKASDKEVKLTEQTLNTIERKGFTLVEWGGTIIE